MKGRGVKVCNLSRLVEFDNSRVAKLVRALDALPKNLRAPKGWISIAIMDDAELAKIHGDFLGDTAHTDVITFEGDADDGFAGEICASAERALEAAAEFSNTPDAELCLYIAHGMLHLAGIDDISAADAKKMRAAEERAAALIKQKFRKEVFKFKKEKNAKKS